MLDAVGQVVAKWGRIDVMINNAGVTHSTVFSKIQEGEFEHMFDVNVEGVYNGAWAAYPVHEGQQRRRHHQHRLRHRHLRLHLRRRLPRQQGRGRRLHP